MAAGMLLAQRAQMTPDADGALLREDPQTGGLELFVHYPAGHVFTPHWHSANDRIILLEGAMSIQVGNGHKELQPAGYARLPAKQVQTNHKATAKQAVFWRRHV
jgi:quercetin dioxygenase-like cupin family protein